MEILVFGAGAIGGYLGGRLALAGHRVTLVARAASAARLDADGLRISQDGVTEIAPVRAVASLAQALAGPTYDLIVLGMKAYDLEAALDQLAALCPRPAHLLSTQNGIGVEEMIARRFGPERVLAGTLTIPISRTGPNVVTVERTGRGLGLAPVQPGRSVAEWAALFTSAGIRAAPLPDYRAMKWSKAFLNIMGNATSAILNRPPAALYRHEAVFNLEMRMLRETLAVMKRLGLRVVNLPAAWVRPLAGVLAYAPRPLARQVFTQVIVHGRGDKMPSFHIDLMAGKGQSEVTFHNGAIAAAGRQVSVATPVNAALNDVLMALIDGRADRATYDGRPDRLLALIDSYQTNGELL